MNLLELQVLAAVSGVPESGIGPSLLDAPATPHDPQTAIEPERQPSTHRGTHPRTTPIGRR